MLTERCDMSAAHCATALSLPEPTAPIPNVVTRLLVVLFVHHPPHPN